MSGCGADVVPPPTGTGKGVLVGCDMDVSYITDRVLAMGSPARKVVEIAEFLNGRHPGHYMVWNLSIEIEYDYSAFGNKVLLVGFPDHHAPPLGHLWAVVLQMDAWLKADSRNVAVMHCHAGRGRTGTVIASYLLYTGICRTPDQALVFFSKRRSNSGKGVSGPSQKRYVEYFKMILDKNLVANHILTTNRELHLHSCLFVGAPLFHFNPLFELVELQHPHKPFRALSESRAKYKMKNGLLDITVVFPHIVAGDVMFRFLIAKPHGHETLFTVSFNTHFVRPCCSDCNGCLSFSKKMLDSPRGGPLKTGLIPDDFYLIIMFGDCGSHPKPNVVSCPHALPRASL
ncbi:phosphatidylinositol 3,4,5-trisphosphate 3-phosphatase and dual-specificity protein phosphatase PTEN [Pelomyxa schiedti]|nr:phosphatidylinositol 3,4,5-trisphosphate 3-phosphatase and dual-specificity protein phosphatase PTEN [Pelomyxa schiedti]